MEVVLAVRSHLSGVSQVLHASLFDTFSGLLRPETISQLMTDRYGPSSLKRAMLQGNLFVALTEHGTIAGCAMADRHSDQLEVEILATDPEYRKTGVGRMLMDHIQRLGPDLPMSVVLLLGGQYGEPFLESEGFVPGEVVEQSLGGEMTVGRRWWRAAQ